MTINSHEMIVAILKVQRAAGEWDSRLEKGLTVKCQLRAGYQGVAQRNITYHCRTKPWRRDEGIQSVTLIVLVAVDEEGLRSECEK